MGQTLYIHLIDSWCIGLDIVCICGTQSGTSCVASRHLWNSHICSCSGMCWSRMDEFRHVHLLSTAIVLPLPSFTNYSLMEFRGVSELGVGLQMLPVVVSGPIACVIAIYILPRVPAYIIFGTSMCAFCTGQILMALTPPDQTYWAMTFPTTVVITFGPDLAFASASLIASDAVPHNLQGVAGSFINTVLNYSIAIGLAFAGNVEVGVNGNGDNPLKGFRGAWWLGTGFAGLGILITAVFYKGMAKKHKHE
jgi:hypothetical protein